ncbi:FecR domain-containing protein [Treponema sp. OMZ 805]|uniref:FecR domain-containing protein n=1 Tax=Treponema sp. OMZ 805 TaxID=2726068 RepID=UPI003D8E7C1A
MKTRKNTKSNPNFKNTGADISVVALCLLIIFICSFLFVRNLNRTFSRNDKTPVATVTFKYKSVQRKFLDRAVWDRPQQNSPVYNGDTIRTSPEAEATLYFVDRNVVELGSSTMIQVFVNNEESRIDLTNGLVSVETSDSSNMLVSSENTTAKISKGSSFRADKSGEGNLQLVVEKGEAAVTGQEEGAQSELLTQGSVIQTGIQAPLVVVSPGKNVRLLNQSGNGVDVPFQWQSSLPAGEELILETSPLSNFSDEVQKYTVTGLTEYTLTQQSISFYWRLYSATTGSSDANVQSGKVNIIAAPAPVLLEPALEAEYSYTAAPPAIRFLWEGNSLVASYLLEVADNPDLKNPQLSRFVNTQSLTLSDFAEGTWYWRVTPRYLIGVENAPEPSKTAFFHIEKQAAIAEIPQVLFPQATAETSRGKEMSFAWKNISETKSYRLKVAKDAEMKTIVVDRVVESNSFKLDDAAALLPNGDYYWTVSGIDSKGAEMAASAPVKFQTVNTDYSLRGIFPPNGYVLADTLCPDTRFTWKTNVETEKHFQVSASKDFSKLVADVKTSGNGIEGISLPQGQWYWRVVADSEAGFLKAETKHFTVASPLAKPTLFDVGNMLVVFPEGKTKFEWSSVKEADYYQVRIIKIGNEDSPVYENLFITGTKVEIALQNVKDGNYRISIQGFAAASVTSTRRYGLAVDHDFVLKHLRPVELVYPANGAKIGGLEAALKPFSFEWESVIPPSSSTLILRKSGVAKPVFEASNPALKVQAPPLESGKYTWEIKAVVPEGFDISSRKRFAFTVLPIPPLPPAAFSFPKADTVLDAAFFKSNRTIEFRWRSVDDATHYRFKLLDSSGRSIFTADIRADEAKDPAVNFKDIARLSRGTFSAEVRAQRRLSNGKVFQDGTVSRVRFQIDIPKARAVSTDETGVLYGK